MSSADVSKMDFEEGHSIEEMVITVTEGSQQVSDADSKEETSFIKELNGADHLSLKRKVMIYAPCVGIIYLASSLLTTYISKMVGIVFIFK